MIHLVVPPRKIGGVYDFSCKLKNSLTRGAARLVYLSKENSYDWEIKPRDSVVLQMSGYGFDKRGAPMWLVGELERRRQSINSMGVFFHELYAFGPPWRSSFWFSPVQRYIVRRLAEISDFWITSRDDSARWLRRYANDKPHAVLPVFSTIGEPVALPEQRDPIIVVFGSLALRTTTYRKAGKSLFEWAKNSSLQIHDIGTPIKDPGIVNSLSTNGVHQHGLLQESQIQKLLLKAQFGLLAYPVGYVAKSSVFAAYCAHGVCPVLISDKYELADELIPGVHCLTWDMKKLLRQDGEVVGKEAAYWYRPHCLERHRQAVLDLMVGGGEGSERVGWDKVPMVQQRKAHDS